MSLPIRPEFLNGQIDTAFRSMLHPVKVAMGNYKCGKLYSLALSDLTPNPDQPRKVFSDPEIQVLADSIKEKGLLQPILVKKVEMNRSSSCLANDASERINS